MAIDDPWKDLEEINKSLAAARHALQDVVEERNALGPPPYPAPDPAESRDALARNEPALDSEEQARREQLFPNKLERYEYLTIEQARLEKQVDGLEHERGAAQKTVDSLDRLLGAVQQVDGQFNKLLGAYDKAVDAYDQQIQALKDAGDRRAFTPYDHGTLKELDAEIVKYDQRLTALENEKGSLFMQVRDALEAPAPEPNHPGALDRETDNAADSRFSDASKKVARDRQQNALDLSANPFPTMDKDLQNSTRSEQRIPERMPIIEKTDSLQSLGLTLAVELATVYTISKIMGDKLDKVVDGWTDRALGAVENRWHDIEMRRLNREESKELTQIANDHRDQRQLLHDMHERQHPDKQQMEREAQAMQRLQEQDVTQCKEKFDELRSEMQARHKERRHELALDKGPERSVQGEVKEMIQDWNRSDMGRTMQQPWDIPGR